MARMATSSVDLSSFTPIETSSWTGSRKADCPEALLGDGADDQPLLRVAQELLCPGTATAVADLHPDPVAIFHGDGSIRISAPGNSARTVLTTPSSIAGRRPPPEKSVNPTRGAASCQPLAMSASRYRRWKRICVTMLWTSNENEPPSRPAAHRQSRRK